MGGMTEQQRALFEAALDRSKQQQETREAVPTERRRTAAQGFSLGFSDEIEARYQALRTGRPYEEVLEEIRGRIKAYQEARPKEALAYEIGGAALPTIGAMVAAPFTGGSSTAAVAPTLARMAGYGALEGGAYAFGTGEGGFSERAARVPGGVVGGSVGGVVGGTVVRAAGGSLNALVDSARRLIGQRGSTVVENEIQRLAAQTGRTPDQIANDIVSGRLLAENATIRQAVRSLQAGGGDASRIIREGIEGRPAQTREAALSDLRRYLSDASEPSALQAQRRSEDATRLAERQAYSGFGTPAPDEVVSALADTLRRVPSASREVEISLKAQTGEAPFFKILEDGSVEFTRTPTLIEAERVRRAVSNRAGALYREGMGGAGEAVAGAEREFRGALDAAAPELGAARSQAAAVRAQSDAFKAGQSALTGDVNERLMEFSRLTSPEDISAYRAGLMATLEARSATGSRASMIRNLGSPEAKENMILREVFPQDQLDDVLYSLETANEAAETARRVLGGSDTAATMLEDQRQGLGLSVSEVASALSGSPDAIVSLSQKFVGRFARDLTDAEKARVANILVSQDPQLVYRAITDESALAALQQRVQDLSARATQASRRITTLQAAEPGADTSGALSRGLLAQ